MAQKRKRKRVVKTPPHRNSVDHRGKRELLLFDLQMDREARRSQRDHELGLLARARQDHAVALSKLKWDDDPIVVLPVD